MNCCELSTASSRIDVSSWITLRWVRGTRYYRVHLEQDLWSSWVLTKVNGRIGSALGRVRSIGQPSIEAALFSLAAIAQHRRERGYHFDAMKRIF
jgi:hypothetical protein